MKELRTYDGHSYMLKDEEAEIAQKMLMRGDKFLQVKGNLIAVGNISSISDKSFERVDRTKQLEGVLHDGTRMTKQFGRWYCTDGQRDDKGNLATEADPDYYPELKTGILPTPTEYETKFNQIPAGKWSDELLMISQSDTELPIQQLENRGSTFLE